MAGRKISKKSKKIIALLEQGVRPYTIFKMGYPEPTVNYYFYKMTRPEKFAKMLESIKKYNKNRKDKVINS